MSTIKRRGGEKGRGYNYIPWHESVCTESTCVPYTTQEKVKGRGTRRTGSEKEREERGRRREIKEGGGRGSLIYYTLFESVCTESVLPQR